MSSFSGQNSVHWVSHIVITPILAIPFGSSGFVIYSDASYQRLGCLLMQKRKVIAYASQQLKTYKQNYPIMI